MKHCPKCNSLMPPEEMRCVRCGFELLQRDKAKLCASSGVSQSASDNPISAELGWGAIWAQKKKELQSREKRIFLVVYFVGLSLLVFLAIRVLEEFSIVLLGIVAIEAFVWFIFSRPLAYVVTLVWSTWMTIVAYKKPNSGTSYQAIVRSIHQLSWTRVFAVVLTSNVFFIASCTGGMVLSRFTRDTAEGRTNIEQERELDARMRVIAAIPSADHSGVQKIVQIPLEKLELFKKANPNYSFLPPPGNGQLEDAASSTRTEYAIASAGPGKVIVETKFHDDEHHVLARYEATEKVIAPLYTRTSHDLVEFMLDFVFGLLLAAVAALVGYILKWRSKRAAARYQ